MKHYNTTNLLKGSLTKAFITMVILATLLVGSCNRSTGKTEPCPLLGTWAITALETRESAQLDELSRKIYEQEVNKMLDSARLVLTPDSTYQLQLGPDSEQGRWKWDPQDSLLRLQSTAGQKSYYILHNNGNQSFKLKKDLDPQELELRLEHLPH